MARFQDAVRRVKNLFKMNNVYDCVRPVLLVIGLAGIGGTKICNTDGVYTLQNTSYSRLVTAFMSVIYLPFFMIEKTINVFTDHKQSLYLNICLLVSYLISMLVLFTISLGYTMSYVSCKRLERVLHIIHNVDRQLAEVNIRVQHWHITLKVAVPALATFHYEGFLYCVRQFRQDFSYLGISIILVTFHLVFTWLILFMLIIHERFVCLTKVLQQNVTVTTIHIVGERSRRDSYVLRRVQLARHVHEQLTEAVQLFSDTCRYVVIGLLTAPMIDILHWSLIVFRNKQVVSYSMITIIIVIFVPILICQANKNERRVRTARIRHLLAYETNREIIQQLQQYTMYNAHAPPGPMDLQFSSMDNVLLLTIIDVVASNILIIYSYMER